MGDHEGPSRSGSPSREQEPSEAATPTGVRPSPKAAAAPEPSSGAAAAPVSVSPSVPKAPEAVLHVSPGALVGPAMSPPAVPVGAGIAAGPKMPRGGGPKMGVAGPRPMAAPPKAVGAPPHVGNIGAAFDPVAMNQMPSEVATIAKAMCKVDGGPLPMHLPKMATPQSFSGSRNWVRGRTNGSVSQSVQFKADSYAPETHGTWTTTVREDVEVPRNTSKQSGCVRAITETIHRVQFIYDNNLVRAALRAKAVGPPRGLPGGGAGGGGGPPPGPPGGGAAVRPSCSSAFVAPPALDAIEDARSDETGSDSDSGSDCMGSDSDSGSDSGSNASGQKRGKKSGVGSAARRRLSDQTMKYIGNALGEGKHDDTNGDGNHGPGGGTTGIAAAEVAAT